MTASIVMTTYNGEEHVKEQLQSLLNQSLKANEVLIYDDGSTDNTINIIREFIASNDLSDSWKLIQNKENKGWKRNFMEGIWKAKGDYIFPCDQDDIWYDNKLEKMIKIMESHQQINLLVSDFEYMYGEQKVRNKPLDEKNPKLEKVELTKHWLRVDFPGCVFCIRRNMAQKSKNYYDAEYAHDDFFWRIGLFEQSLYILHDELIGHRVYKESTFSKEVLQLKTRPKKIEWLDLSINCCKSLMRMLNNDNITGKEKNLIVGTEKALKLRKKFYQTRNPIYGIMLIKYLNNYQFKKQYLGDWFFIYFR